MRVPRWSFWVLSSLCYVGFLAGKGGAPVAAADPAASRPAAAASNPGKTYRLQSSRTKGETTHVETLLEVAGDLSLVDS